MIASFHGLGHLGGEVSAFSDMICMPLATTPVALAKTFSNDFLPK